MDALDRLAADAFAGFVVRKDLALRFKGQYPVPTYVGEFLLGRYCATTDEEEIDEGLKIVERLMADRTVRAGEEELFKSRARESGTRQGDRPDHRAARHGDRRVPRDAAEPAAQGRPHLGRRRRRRTSGC